jgi:hypothetical protein
MRSTYNAEWIVHPEQTTIVGLNLGAEYCAEHENGIAGIHSAFGVTYDDHVYGIDKRRVRKVPEHLEFGMLLIPAPEPRKNELRKAAYLILRNPWAAQISDYRSLPRELTLYGDQTIMCAWDESHFGILATGDDIEKLKELYQALSEKDAVIGIGKQLNPFHRAGLVIAIISRLPKETAEKMYQEDKDYHELLLAVEATGIEAYLRAAGKRYWGLTPTWADKEKRKILFWLNPVERDRYNFGWFNVEDLRQWAEEKGPIVRAR